MADEPNAAPSSDQDRIWRHFQNRAVESFDAARPRLEFLVRQVARRAAGTVRVLNIGTGSGHFERQALARGWEAHALDPDAAALERLSAAGVRTHVGRVERLPLGDAEFDFVVASEVLEHLSEQIRAAALGEIARVLKPGGWFLGTVPYEEDLSLNEVVCPCCGEVFHRWGHQASFSEALLAIDLSSQFRIEELRHTAFVPWRGRGPGGVVKSLVRLLLARWGQAIAIPTIYWAARRVEN